MNKKAIPYIFLFCSVCWYIAAILNFVNHNNSMGTTFLCLGSAWLCVSSLYINKNKSKEKEEDTKGETNEK